MIADGIMHTIKTAFRVGKGKAQDQYQIRTDINVDRTVMYSKGATIKMFWADTDD